MRPRSGGGTRRSDPFRPVRRGRSSKENRENREKASLGPAAPAARAPISPPGFVPFWGPAPQRNSTFSLPSGALAAGEWGGEGGGGSSPLHFVHPPAEDWSQSRRTLPQPCQPAPGQRLTTLHSEVRVVPLSPQTRRVLEAHRAKRAVWPSFSCPTLLSSP